ncbi:MAG: hypothetical protein RIQ93_2853 [Verrucomicrobiota bacterium]
MLAGAAAEVVATWLVEGSYRTGLIFGWFASASEWPPLETLLAILTRLLAVAVTTAFVLWRSRESWRDLGQLRFAPATLALGFLPIVASMPIFISEVDNLIRSLLPSSGLEDWDFAPEIGRLVGGSWQGLLLAVVVAPFTEEVFFRGILLRGFLGIWRPWAAIVMSAALFSVLHLNPAQAPVAFALGLVLGWIYMRTRSLGLCMLGHALNNASAYLGADLPWQIANYNFEAGPEAGFFHPWWFDVAGLSLFAGGLALIHLLAPARLPWSAPPPVPAAPPRLPFANLPPLLPVGKSLGGSAVLAEPHPSMSAELVELVTSLAQRARAAALTLATTPTAAKNAALLNLADLIDASHESLLAANALDLASPEAASLTPAARDRLTLNVARLQHLAESVRVVVDLPDPAGDLLEEIVRPNGLRIRKIRVPIGVIGIIYEARPNVTIDCAVLCLKSGNACILRGGKECFHTNTALAALITQALASAGVAVDAVQLVPTTDRAALTTLLKLDSLIHCIIPRGGESLIRFVAQNSTIPVIKHYKGVCFVYVDAAADLAMAEAISLNAKVQRPSACNAAEQLLVHRQVADQFLPIVARALVAQHVELRCDPASAAILERENVATTPAVPADYSTEFLDYVIAVRVVDSLDAAIATINRDSSNHSDAIVTASEAAARRFLAEVDSATVYWNASTRFTDGFEFGYGAEIGISTDRLHARGPMGLRELCTYKFVIEGAGQIRS